MSSIPRIHLVIIAFMLAALIVLGLMLPRMATAECGIECSPDCPQNCHTVISPEKTP